MTFVSANSRLSGRIPCLVGVAQRTDRSQMAPEPLVSWQLLAEAAAADAGSPDLLHRLDSVQVVYCQSWQYDDPAGRLADAIGASPRHRFYSGIGGTVPLTLLTDAARAIHAGEYDAALVVGAEALATKRALKKAGERPAWSHRHPQPPPFPMERMPAAAEIAHEVFLATDTFAMFDVARRASRGDSLEAERKDRGLMMSPMSAVAAANPHAWFPRERSPDELVTASPDNRYVGWPYTKYTVSVMDVDMAAAALLVSSELADSLGISPERRLYLRGSAYAEDPWTVAAHPDLASAPAMVTASTSAFGQAGIGVDDVGYFDLYSCFASSLRFACDAIGLDPLDPRGLTVTGGLPFAGGPASNYTLHAIASMADRLRADPGAFGVVTGVGMHLTKHAWTVWSSIPGGLGPALSAPEPQTRAVVETYDGPAEVASYVVSHGRSGPERALLILDLPEGGRTYGVTRDESLMEDAMSRELVGQAVTVSTDGRLNTVRW